VIRKTKVEKIADKLIILIFLIVFILMLYIIFEPYLIVNNLGDNMHTAIDRLGHPDLIYDKNDCLVLSMVSCDDFDKNNIHSIAIWYYGIESNIVVGFDKREIIVYKGVVDNIYK